MCIPLLSGCFGVYGEVAATTYPSASLGSTGSPGASSVGVNVGVDFGNVKRRFAMGYEQQSISVKDGSGSLGASSARFDFNVLSLSDRAKLRLGGAFGFGTGSSKLAGMTRNDASGGGAYAGVGFTYFPTWHIGLHALAGPAFGTMTMPEAGSTKSDFSGTGVTFRIAVTYQFSDVRPDVTRMYPLEHDNDITGLLEEGARGLGCTTFRRSSSTYAYLDLTCNGEQMTYFQVAQGMMVQCHHMFERACDDLSERVLASTKKSLPAPAAVPPRAVPAAMPAPEPAQPPAPADAGSAAAEGQ
jgi:hypothetical protein